MKVIEEIKIGRRKAFLHKSNLKSDYGDSYYLKGFVCPFCGNKHEKQFLLCIHEKVDKETRKVTYREVGFMCTDYLTPITKNGIDSHCGIGVQLGVYGSGVTIENIVKHAIENYKTWKCNGKR